jgi:signal transduction histidine kinase
MRHKHYLLPLLLAGVILVLIAGALAWPWSRPDSGLAWRAGVYQVLVVEAGGPAAAGFQVGDVILAQDGRPMAQVQPRYGSGRPSEEVTFTIARGDLILEETVRLRAAPAAKMVERLQPALVALGFWLTAVVAWAQKPKAADVRLFLLFCLLIAGVLSTGSLSTQEYPGARQLYAVFLGILVPVSVHFHLLFLQARPLSRFVPALGGVYLVGILLGFWPAVSDIGLLSPPPQPFLFIYLALAGLVSTGLLVYTYSTVDFKQERQRVRVVLLGTAMGTSPLLLGSIIPDIVFGAPWLPYPFAFMFLVLVPLAYAYAMHRHDFLQLDRYADRTVVLFGLTLGLVGGYLLLIHTFNRLMPPAWQNQPLLGASIALLLAGLLAPLRQALVKVVDTTLYGAWYDYRSAIQTFTNKFSNAFQSEQIIQILTGQLPALLHIQGAALLWSRGERLVIGGVGGDTETWRGQLEIAGQSSSTPLQRYLLVHGKPSHFSTIVQVLEPDFPGRPARQQSAAEDTLWVPLIYSGYLMGVLVLGPKRGDNNFSWKDLQILETLSHQAAVAIQQVQLIDSLRQHGLEMNRLYQAVVTAREAERKHLARELHDGVIQDLIGLKHRLERIVEAADPPSSEERSPQRQVTDLVDTLRHICAGLRPPVLDSLGLVPAVRYHLRQFEAATGLNTKFSIQGDELQELPEEVELCLFRVLQEALHNVQHHAQARNVTVSLTLRPTTAGLVIDDDGRGFGVPECLGEMVANGHFGLAGLRERVEAAKGHLSIHSAPGSGTWLKIEVPLAEAVTDPESRHLPPTPDRPPTIVEKAAPKNGRIPTS